MKYPVPITHASPTIKEYFLSSNLNIYLLPEHEANYFSLFQKDSCPLSFSSHLMSNTETPTQSQVSRVGKTKGRGQLSSLSSRSHLTQEKKRHYSKPT